MKQTKLSFGVLTLGVFALMTPACDDSPAAAQGAETGGVDTIGGSTSGGDGGELTGSDDGGGTGGGTGDGPVDACADEEQAGDETDVDCGGASCAPCSAGQRCNENADCETEICAGGFCQTPTCYDGLQNGNEDGVDCGGGCPNVCVDNSCQNDAQCGADRFCMGGSCVPSSCRNMVQDTLETDVDCGGLDCPACGAGQACSGAPDCDTGSCDPMTLLCLAPACDDMVLNGDETDLDCGGTCGPCIVGASCMDGSDCVEGVCDFQVCQSAACNDGVQNGNETGSDCGGPCSPCPDGSACNDGNDCQNGVCNMNVCVGPTCMDMAKNGDETDTDCGGSCGATCIPGQECGGSADCVEGVCEFGLCSNPDCQDSVQNGDETDFDCGGACGATCVPGQVCMVDGDCTEGVCDNGTCAMPSCMDSTENGDETDLDCGGACGATCTTGQVCMNGGDCVEGVCFQSSCQAPACDDNVQNGNEAGVDCAGSCDRPCPTGMETTVNTVTNDFQVQPKISASPSGGYSVVTWASFPVTSPPEDGSGAGVFAQVYSGAGTPIGGQVQVNTYFTANQQFPAVDAGDTGFVIAWQSDGQDGDANGIYAQRYDTAGLPVGGEIAVNTTTVGDQRRPDVAIDSSGRFVVCWETFGTTYEIACQRYTAGGTTDGGEMAINTTTTNNQQLVVVERNDAGAFTVAWQSAGDQDLSGVGVYRRRFASDGSALDLTDVQVNSYTTGDQSGPAIGMNGAGAFTIAWSSDGQDGSSTGVYAQRYASDGSTVGTEFPAHITTVGAQNNPAVAINADGESIIVWQTADDGVLTGVFGQRYDSAGTPIKTEFRVNPTSIGLQEVPDVTVLGTTEFIGVWSSGDVGFNDRDIVMQGYAAEFP